MSSSLRRLTLAALLLTPAFVLTTCATPAVAQDDVIEVKGRIEENDPVDPIRKKPAKTHTVKLSKGKQYQIDMTSTDLDSYLRLINGAGKQVAFDDDGGGFPNARITYTPNDDDTFTIVATSFDGKTGAFVLTIQGAGAKLVPGGKVKAGGGVAAPEGNVNINGNLAAGDNPDPVRKHPCKVHEVKLKKGVPYQIDMKSADFDSYLRLEDDNGRELAQDDDGGGFPDARIQFTPTKDGAYKIYATSFDGGTGAYTLIVMGKGGAAGGGNAAAMPAPAANQPSEVTAKLAQTDPADPVRNKASRVYVVELKAGKSYQIDLMSTDFDCYLRFEGPNGNQIAEDDDGGEGLNSRISFDCPANGRYRIIATTFNGQVGEFVLRVTEK